MDWWWLKPFAILGGIGQDLEVSVSFDIKTSRRVRGEDRTLFFVIENASTSVATIEFNFSFRLLLKRS